MQLVEPTCGNCHSFCSDAGTPRATEVLPSVPERTTLYKPRGALKGIQSAYEIMSLQLYFPDVGSVNLSRASGAFHTRWCQALAGPNLAGTADRLSQSAGGIQKKSRLRLGDDHVHNIKKSKCRASKDQSRYLRCRCSLLFSLLLLFYLSS